MNETISLPCYTDELTQEDIQISFGMTLAPLLGLKKTVTRRFWSQWYVNKILHHVSQRGLVYATTNWRNGEIVGTLDIISITEDNDLENITQEEVNSEGYSHFTPEEFLDAFFENRGEKRKKFPNKKYFRVEFQVKLYEGKFKHFSPRIPITPFTFDGKKKQINLWKTYLLAFDLKDKIKRFKIGSDEWQEFYVTQAMEHGVNCQQLNYFLKEIKLYLIQ